MADFKTALVKRPHAYPRKHWASHIFWQAENSLERVVAVRGYNT
jgi:hypothetical protein